MSERNNLPSASSFERLKLCPGSFLLTPVDEVPGKGKPEISEDAEIGNRIHAAVACVLSGGAMPDMIPDEAIVAQQCLRMTKELLADIEFRNYESFIEKRIWSTDGRWSGKPDAAFLNDTKDKALIIDFKTGRGKVELAHNNLQLRALAVLVSAELKVTDIVVAIVQPLSERETVSLCQYGKADLLTAKREMYQIVTNALLPPSPRRAGSVQCKFCKCKEICPEYAEWCSSNLPASTRQYIPIAKWSPENWAEFLKWESSARKWLADTKELAKLKLQSNPNSIPGFKLRRRKRRSISDAILVYQRASKHGVKAEAFGSECRISLEALRKLLGEASTCKGGPLEEILNECIDGLIEESEFFTVEES